MWVDLNHICAPVWPRPDLRSRSRSFRSCENCTFLGLISSAALAWSSKLMVAGDSMGRGLQLVGVRFLNFLLGKLSWEFKLRRMSIFHEIQMAIFRWGYSQMVGHAGYYRYSACWYDLDPIQGQGQGHGAFELPKISETVRAGGDSPLCGAFWFIIGSCV